MIDNVGVDHELHFLDIPDEVCKMRLRNRNATGLHPYATTETEFDQVIEYFVPPSGAEGFHVIRHEQRYERGHCRLSP